MNRNKFSWQEMLRTTPANKVESITPAPLLTSTMPIARALPEVRKSGDWRLAQERMKLQQRIANPSNPQFRQALGLPELKFTPEMAANKMMAMSAQAGPYAQELAGFSPPVAEAYVKAQKAPEMASAATRTALAGAGAAEFQTGQLPAQASQQQQEFTRQQAQQEAEELRKAQEFTRQQELLKQTDPLEVQKMTQEVSAPPMTQQQTIRVQQLQQDRQGILEGTIQAPPGTLEQIDGELRQLLSAPSSGMPVSPTGAPPMDGAAVEGMPPPAGMTSPQTAPVQPSRGYSLRPSVSGQLAFGEKEAKVIMDSTGLSMSDSSSPKYDTTLDPMSVVGANWDVPEYQIITTLGNFVANLEKAISLSQNEQAKEMIKRTIRNNPNYAEIINAHWARKMTGGDIVRSPIISPLDRLFHGGQFTQTIALVDKLRRLVEDSSQGAPPMGGI